MNAVTILFIAYISRFCDCWDLSEPRSLLSNYRSVKLEIDNPSDSEAEISERVADDVTLKSFISTRQICFDAVSEDGKNIWTPPTGGERAIAVHMYYKSLDSALLSVHTISGSSYITMFFEKKFGSWNSLRKADFDIKLELLKYPFGADGEDNTEPKGRIPDQNTVDVLNPDMARVYPVARYYGDVTWTRYHKHGSADITKLVAGSVDVWVGQPFEKCRMFQIISNPSKPILLSVHISLHKRFRFEYFVHDSNCFVPIEAKEFSRRVYDSLGVNENDTITSKLFEFHIPKIEQNSDNSQEWDHEEPIELEHIENEEAKVSSLLSDTKPAEPLPRKCSLNVSSVAASEIFELIESTSSSPYRIVRACSGVIVDRVVDGNEPVWESVADESCLSISMLYENGGLKFAKLSVSGDSGPLMLYFEKTDGSWSSLTEEVYGRKTASLTKTTDKPKEDAFLRISTYSISAFLILVFSMTIF